MVGGVSSDGEGGDAGDENWKGGNLGDMGELGKEWGGDGSEVGGGLPKLCGGRR